MRAPQLVSDFFDWRWAPCVGLTAGSLGFVALALLLIPTRFGGDRSEDNGPSSFTSQPSPRAIFGASLTRSGSESEPRRAERLRVARPASSPAPPMNRADTPPPRGFSPIIERPETLPTAPSMAEPPPPAPGSVVIIQPEPGGPAREVTTQ